MGDHRPTLLIVLTDFPGLHYRIAERIGMLLEHAGMRTAFLLSSPYMERFKRVVLSSTGPVFHMSERIDPGAGSHLQPPDQWWMHPSFVRQEHYRGHSLVSPDDYGPMRAAVEGVIDDLGRVDLVWSEPPTNATLSVVHHVCSDRDLPCWGIGAGRVPGHFHISTDFMATKLMLSDGVGVPATMPEGVPDYHRRTLSNEPAPVRTEARVRSGLSAVLGGRSVSKEIGFGPIWQLSALLRRGQRGVRQRVHRLAPGLFDNARDCMPDPERDPAGTFLFPLHVRPEASTSMWARFLEDDIQTVRNLAFSLPGGATLVVKEHPAAVGSRAASFYRALKRFPGVRLAGPDFPASDHLASFTGVVVLTSTMGFEALQHGVPVLALGRIFYEEYPGVERALDWSSVTPFYRRARAGEIRTAPSEIWPIYRRHCFPGLFDIFDPAAAEPDNIARLAAPLLSFLQRTP